MKKYLSTLIIALFGITLYAQDIQWAHEIVSFSSQYDKSAFSAKQVLGPPNKYPAWGKSEVAWAPKSESRGLENVRVKFKKPIHVRQVLVAETLSPGAIYQIFLYDEKGKGHKVFESKTKQSVYGEARLFGQKISVTPYKVSQLKLVINTDMVRGMQQIDAIGISESTKKVEVKINAATYDDKVLPPEKLSSNVNSRYAERLPIISPNGQTLYYARKWHPENIGTEMQDDIWISDRMSNNDWARSQNPGAPLNNATHNFVVAVSPDGQTLYLANDYRSNKKDGVSVSKWRNGKWTDPKALKIVNHYNRNKFVCYHVGVDGNVMLMTVERDDGLGDRDIYVSFRYNDGDWSEPKNVGKTINTSGMEASVFLAADMKTIYFSSDGHRGYGGLDVFMSRRLDFTWQNWSEPVNLGPVINTPGNDLNYSIPASGEYAYFSSDIGSADLMSNLYRIRLPEEVRPEPVTVMKGRFIDAETKKPIQAKVEYKTKQEITEVLIKKPTEEPTRQPTRVAPTEAPKDIVSEVEAEDDGEFEVVLQNENNYEILPKIEGYFTASEDISLIEEEQEELDYDGNDPEILEEIKKPTYKPDPVTTMEVDRLRNKLALLEDDLNDIEEKRTAAKDKVNDVANTDYYYEPYEYKPSYTNPDPIKKTEPVILGEEDLAFTSPEDVPYQAPTRQNQIDDDPELTELQKKYLTLFNEPEDNTPVTTIKKSPRTTELEDKYASLFNDDEDPAPKKPRRDKEEERPTQHRDWEKEPTDYAYSNQNPKADGNPDQNSPEENTTPEQPRNNQAEDPKPTKDRAQKPKNNSLEEKYAALFDDEEDKELNPGEYKVPEGGSYRPGEGERPDGGEYRPGEAPIAEGGGYKPGQAPIAEGGGYQPGQAEKPEGGGYQPGQAPKPESGSYQPGQAPVASGGVGHNDGPTYENNPDGYRPPMPTFDELKDQVRREVETELRAEVRKDLQEELLTEVKKELENDLEDDIRDQLKGDLKQDVEDQLKNDLQQEIEDQLRNDLKTDVEDQLRDDLKGDVEDKLRDDLKKEVEADLRKTMKDDIESKLRDELKAPIKEELRKELEYRYKKELEQKLRRELEQNIRKQMAERQRDYELANPESAKPAEGQSGYRELSKDIMLYPIKVGQIIPLNNIYFDANKSTLKEASNNELARVFEFLDSNPNLIVEIRGHTNGLCSDAFAASLSKERSMAVANALKDGGIPADRLTFKGYGKTLPVASNSSSEGRRKNQRVELKILEIKE